MVYGVKGFAEVQEDHSAETSLLNICMNISKEVYQTSPRGVSLPEPQLIIS